MEKNQITTAPLLDIIFDGRNKEYGAYELRKKYNDRLTKALVITAGLAAIILLSSYALSSNEGKVKFLPVVPVVDLKEVDIPKDEPVIIPPKPVEPPRVATIRDVTFRVVKDEEVKKEEMPPEVDDKEDAKISTVTQDGGKFEGVIAPPVDNVSSVMDAPKGKPADTVFLKVEKEAEFPGGAAAWTRYVSREVNRNIDELQDDGRSGSVMINFIVDTEGNVSDVRVLNCGQTGINNCLGSGSKLAEIALNAIRKGPKWIPALQNGKHVKAYRNQAVTFQLQEE
ncbi:energy transducer TonB [Pollutibacter soli]|uniref:energy transducer TonB n=1 Tax=Pollutibacter soli TaxID=3034157 RepID=UPI003013655E